MKYINCPGCNRKVSSKVRFCPHCGFQANKEVEAMVVEEPKEVKSKSNGIERRETQRIRNSTMVRINNKLGLIIDLSRNGLKLSTDMIPPNPQVEISIQTDDQTINLKGIICWVSKKRSYSNLKDIGIYLPEVPSEYVSFFNSIPSNQDTSEFRV